MLVVDGQLMFLGGLCSLLAHVGLDVVGRATEEETAVARAVELEPDVIVIDIWARGMSGAATVERLSDVAPASRVVVLTDAAATDGMIEALAAGACGYLLKESSLEEVVAGIHSAASRRTLVLPRMVAPLFAQIPVRPANGEVGLSERELEVLGLLAAGLDNAEIAAELTISPATAKCHVSRILEKLETANRVQAAVYAVRTGLV